MAVQLVIIVILLLVNGLFAMGEIVIVSSRKTRLQQWANEGNVKAKTALGLAPGPYLLSLNGPGGHNPHRHFGGRAG